MNYIVTIMTMHIASKQQHYGNNKNKKGYIHSTMTAMIKWITLTIINNAQGQQN